MSQSNGHIRINTDALVTRLNELVSYHDRLINEAIMVRGQALELQHLLRALGSGACSAEENSGAPPVQTVQKGT